MDLIMHSTFQEANPDKDPLVVLPCGHVFTMSTMDGHLELGEVYSRDDDSGAWLEAKPSSPAIGDTPKGCPLCRCPVYGLQRYGRVLKKLALDLAHRKFLITSDKLVQKLYVSVEKVQRAVQSLFGNAEGGQAGDQGASIRSTRAALKNLAKHTTETIAACATSPLRRVYEGSVSALERLQPSGPVFGKDLSGEPSVGQSSDPTSPPATRTPLLLPPRPDNRTLMYARLVHAQIQHMQGSVLLAHILHEGAELSHGKATKVFPHVQRQIAESDEKHASAQTAIKDVATSAAEERAVATQFEALFLAAQLGERFHKSVHLPAYTAAPERYSSGPRWHPQAP